MDRREKKRRRQWKENQRRDRKPNSFLGKIFRERKLNSEKVLEKETGNRSVVRIKLEKARKKKNSLKARQ